MTQKPLLQLNIVIYKEEGEWLAHCLELDLVTTSENPRQAYDDMRDVIKAHIEFAVKNDNWQHIFKPAPPEAWNRMFALQHQAVSPIVETEELDIPSCQSLPLIKTQSLAYAA